MKIAVDVMGGDFAPKAIVEGALLAANELTEQVRIVLIGNQADIQEVLGERTLPATIEIVHTTEVIAMGEHPTKALSQKPNSSIGVGFKLLKERVVDAFCSAGNTGAMHVGALFSVKAVEGLIRPAIVGFAPQVSGKMAVLLDIGANADCKPEMLEQFGEIGSLYAQYTHGVDNPRVALVNIGEEEQKGSLVAQAAHQLMKATKKYNFIGNLEGKELFTDKADVIVCDGFTGNVILKMGESIYDILKSRGVDDEFVNHMNYEAAGGSPILGVNGNVIIAHGISSPLAIKSMILLAKRQVESDVYTKIKQALS
ncbi:phosphate--acyl-ACP acyltransferase [Siphonobacter sp. BAB-5385]|uniref:Phosphate acyltransferase n=1 Tax=Siphonobacter curvatus TaxID=2094562 RepID=A0A2S7IJ56_9BACT|nr:MULTISPECIES: phosphate acyltransferase PlsX [Siphonobacter]OZI06313.1 phosphate--acyl-ACP acyltransferase [Siphonobacter sp. BAB-5385]PMD96074.1 phosphate--acyl-ACP acyltransferase [Siphonobacter sp. BAB-5405]PQA56217.1 phosphate acyltransferase PlsX [Siphonobacter curvatus]